MLLGESFLRIVPVSVEFLLLRRAWELRVIPSEAYEASIERLSEEFPAYGSVLLRLAVVNLRTVIVTAAVYRGFDQELAPHHLTFRHRAGVTPYTSTRRVCRVLCFC